MSEVCKECDREYPADPEVFIPWLKKQAIRLKMDELIYGCSYFCPSCCTRYNPTEIVENPDGIWRLE